MRSLTSVFGGRRALITGGLGFIGSSLAARLVELGADVLVVDSLIPAYGGNLYNIEAIRDRVRVNIADVRDRSSLNYLVKGHDFLFNLAGTLSHIDSMTDPFTDLEINCVSQLSILESCRVNNPSIRIVFSGTRGQYGRATELPVRESHPMRPTDVNGINNLAGELYHLLYNDVHGIRATSLRLTNTYGPRHQMRTHKQGIINWFVRQLIDGETVRIFGDGCQVRDTVYIDDVVDALLLAMASDRTPGEAYNLGGFPASLLEIVETMIQVFGKGRCELVPYPENLRPIEIGDYVADYGKFRDAVGWVPRVDLKTGLARTFEYYLAHRAHYW